VPNTQNEPKSDGHEPPAPALANPEAAHRVGDALSSRFAATIDSTGKALAVLAGLGAFFIGAGYVVEWQRFRQGNLPSEQVLPLVPKDQIAAAGARELAISLLFVTLSLLLLGFIIFRLARWTQGRQGRAARLASRLLAKDIALPTAIVGVLTLLVVPYNDTGVLVAAIVTGLVLYGLLLIRRFLETDGESSFPLWRLVLAVALAAIVLAGARQSEFGEARPNALICLNDGTSFEGDYVASDQEKILIRKRLLSGEQRSTRAKAVSKLERAREVLVEASPIEKREARLAIKDAVLRLKRVRTADSKRNDGLECADAHASDAPKSRRRRRKGRRPQLIVVPVAQVEEILVGRESGVLHYDTSLLDRITSDLPGLPDIKLTCIPPECRWEKRRIGPSSYL
jgi:hypothetical protein